MHVGEVSVLRAHVRGARACVAECGPGLFGPVAYGAVVLRVCRSPYRCKDIWSADVGLKLALPLWKSRGWCWRACDVLVLLLRTVMEKLTSCKGCRSMRNRFLGWLGSTCERDWKSRFSVPQMESL